MDIFMGKRQVSVKPLGMFRLAGPGPSPNEPTKREVEHGHYHASWEKEVQRQGALLAAA
jgi:hypothetical protein